MKTFRITTLAEGRVKSKATMEHLIQAETQEDAFYEARQAHIWKKRVAMDRSIFIISAEEVPS